MEHFDGYWNHGLSQALALMIVGGRLGQVLLSGVSSFR